MKKNKNLSLYPPLIYNIFKPARMTSYDVVRHFKRHLPDGYGKIGHFGTLDPFACGVLMIGTGGAARLNEFIHDFLPKTYLAIGKLGVETPTGDHTGEISQRDESAYLREEISRLPLDFINTRLREKFLGTYNQVPHKYSATKFMGRNLHQWAREGVEVKKEAVQREIYEFNIVKYEFPYLCFRVTVSSGTYVRTLFTDMCQDLGTIGCLVGLVREKVGGVGLETSIKKNDWAQDKDLTVMKRALNVEDVLNFGAYTLSDYQARGFRCGAFMKPSELKVEKTSSFSAEYFWMKEEGGALIGLSQLAAPDELRPKINFNSEEKSLRPDLHSLSSLDPSTRD